MFKKSVLNIVSYVMFALLFFKVAAPHAYSHDESAFDKIENCTICDSAVENDENDYFIEPIISYSVPKEIFSENKRIVLKVHSFSSFNVHFGLFGRPPPSLA